MGDSSNDLEDHTVNLDQLHRVFVAILIFVVINAIGTTYALYQIYDVVQTNQDQAQKFVVKQCQTSNAARESLIDLLNFAKHRVTQTPTSHSLTAEQKAQAIDFYDAAIARIKIIDCSGIEP